MMTKKIWNIALLVMIAMCMGLASCSSDNDKNDEPGGGGDDSSIEALLLGKWRITYSSNDYYQMDFRSNGKCYCEELSAYDNEVDRWVSNYSVSGSRVIFTYDDDPYDVDFFEIFDITKTKLIVAWDGDMDDTEVFTKIK